MKGFKYSCFISYRKQPIVEEFVEQLTYALDRELSILLDNRPVFGKEWLTMTVGENFLEVMGNAIRESACYIVVYTPTYQTSRHCTAELLMMLRCEEARAKHTGDQGIVFPIVLRGADRMPNVLKKRQVLDFSSFISAGTRLSRHPTFAREVSRLAEEIAHIYRDMAAVFSKERDPAKDIPLINPHGPEVTEFIEKNDQDIFFPLPQF